MKKPTDFGSETLDRSLFSPELSPTDYHFFKYLNVSLHEMWFQNQYDAKGVIANFVASRTLESYAAGRSELVSRQNDSLSCANFWWLFQLKSFIFERVRALQSSCFKTARFLHLWCSSASETARSCKNNAFFSSKARPGAIQPDTTRRIIFGVSAKLQKGCPRKYGELCPTFFRTPCEQPY